MCEGGTFLEQGGPAEFYERQYPQWAGIILTLGLDKVYGSPIFLVIVGWLAFSIAACTGTSKSWRGIVFRSRPTSR